MAYTLTQQLTSGMAGKGIVNTYDIDDRIQGKTQEAINQDLYQKLVDTGNIAAGISTVDYDSDTKRINFRSSDSTIVCYLDATLFIKDGIINSVRVDNVEIDNTLTKCLIISFNTDADKQDIIIPIKDIIDQDLFYTKTEIDSYHEGINSSITDLQNSRLFKEENGGLKTNINNKASGANSFSEGLNTNALGENSHSEGKGLNISSNPEEAYTAGDNFIIVANNENIVVGSKLRYPKKVENVNVISKSYGNLNGQLFVAVDIDTPFAENINAGEYVYINDNGSFTPVEVILDYITDGTEIDIDSSVYDSIDEGTVLSSNAIDASFGVKTITDIEVVENNVKLYLDSPIEYDLITTDIIYIESGIANGQGSHSEGLGTNAVGDYSHASGVFTNTKNEGEFACGTRNKSTEDVTVFSVGIGETSQLNALEVNTDGDLYIKGTGGYDGTNITGTGVKSVQEILSEARNAALEARVSAIEARFVQEIIDKITGGISFTLGNLYAGYPKTVTATGTVSLPPEVTADKITSIKLVGNGQTVEESGQTSVNIQNSVTAPQTYTLTASIAAPYTKTISKTATINQVCPIYIALVDSNIDTAAKVITEIAKVDNLYSSNSPLSNIKSITNKAFTYAANQRLAFICGQSGIRVKQVGGLADDPYTVNGESTTINGMTAYVYLTGTQQAGTRNITFNP